MSAFGEKHPWALKPRRFLFGLFTVQFWEYRCVLSNAQIELMCADIPRIDYDSDVAEEKNKSDLEKAREYNKRKAEELKLKSNKST